MFCYYVLNAVVYFYCIHPDRKDISPWINIIHKVSLYGNILHFDSP